MDPAAAAKGIFNQPVTNTGAALADMLLGYVDFSGLNQYPRFYTRQSNYSFFAQDNWRVSRRLTLNLGLRYEYWTPFADKRDQLSTLNLNAPGGPAVVYPGSGSITKQGFPQAVVDAYTQAGLRLVRRGRRLPVQSLEHAEKQLGATSRRRLLNGDKTVMRGAYGVYYWAMPLVQYHQNTRRNPPYSYSFQSAVDNNDSTAAELVLPAGGSAFGTSRPTPARSGNSVHHPERAEYPEGQRFPSSLGIELQSPDGAGVELHR